MSRTIRMKLPMAAVAAIVLVGTSRASAQGVVGWPTVTYYPATTVYSAPPAVIPAPVVSYFAPAPVVAYSAPAPVVSFSAPAPVLYPAPAVAYYPSVATTSYYGPFGRRVATTTYYAPPVAIFR